MIASTFPPKKLFYVLPSIYPFCDVATVGETGVGWDTFWLGQCHSVRNESPYGDTNDVFGEHVTTAFTGSTRIIDARFASEISPKIPFGQQK